MVFNKDLIFDYILINFNQKENLLINFMEIQILITADFKFFEVWNDLKAINLKLTFYFFYANEKFIELKFSIMFFLNRNISVWIIRIYKILKYLLAIELLEFYILI